MSIESFDNATDADLDDSPIPEEVDWRKEGHVSPVRNQWACGTCYAFGSVIYLYKIDWWDWICEFDQI